MNIRRLLLLPFFLGLVLMLYSWYLSYPLSVASADDFIFGHISIFYWISLPLLLVSMFLMAVTTKNNYLKWILSIGIILTLFSLPYFYSIMPTGDSQQFRAYVEYFTQNHSLDASQLNHNYYQWPAFFVLANVVTSITGLPLTSYEFFLFTLLSFLIGTALFMYGTKRYVNGGIVVVAIFFISLTYFIDFQPVPFTLGLVLLFLLFMLDAHPKSIGIISAMLVIFGALLFTHLFVPLFFVLYLLMRSIFEKNSEKAQLYRSFFLITLVSYFLIQLSIAKFSFAQLVTSITQTPMQSLSFYISAATAESAQYSINNIAQQFSRTVTILAILVSAIGLLILLFKRKTNAIDKAILFAGAIYSVLGVVLNTLGYRAVAVAFIPISLGMAFLSHGKLKVYTMVLITVLLALFVFIPIHTSFTTQVSFQTSQNYVADNFFLNHYNWQNPGVIVSDFWTFTYLEPKLTNYHYIFEDFSSGAKVNAVLYTPQLAGVDLANQTNMQNLSQEEGFNVLYNDGYSFVLTNPS